jgi:hypothetical protein
MEIFKFKAFGSGNILQREGSKRKKIKAMGELVRIIQQINKQREICRHYIPLFVCGYLSLVLHSPCGMHFSLRKHQKRRPSLFTKLAKFFWWFDFKYLSKVKFSTWRICWVFAWLLSIRLSRANVFSLFRRLWEYFQGDTIIRIWLWRERPTSQPTGRPTSRPTGQPSRQPTAQPSRQPNSAPFPLPVALGCLLFVQNPIVSTLEGIDAIRNCYEL